VNLKERQFNSRSEYANALAAPWRREFVNTTIAADMARDEKDYLTETRLRRKCAMIRAHLSRLESMA